MNQYKILIVKNRYTKNVDTKKYVKWFKDNANLDVQVSEMKTDFDVTTQDISNATFKGVICGADLIPKLKTVIKEEYNAVVFIYGNDLNGIRVSCCNGNGSLYPNTELIQLAKNDWKVLNHETFHAFFAKAKRFGAQIEDNMDTYFRDTILVTDNGETSRTIALRSLAPHWNKICTIAMNTQTEVKPVIQNSDSIFNRAVEIILAHEGGYVNDHRDPGGETKYGISKRAYHNIDIKNLTIEQAKDIYHRDYWLKAKCDQMSYGIALLVFDTAVNTGIKNASIILQKILKVTTDGIIGNQTLGALKAYSGQIEIDYSCERMKYYQSLSTFQTYKNGWTTRTFETLKLSFK